MHNVKNDVFGHSIHFNSLHKGLSRRQNFILIWFTANKYNAGLTLVPFLLSPRSL